MSQIDKLIKKFNRVPIPNDITFDEVKSIARHYGCRVKEDSGRHSLHIAHPTQSWGIPIPTHGNCVKEAYIKQLKMMFSTLEEDNHEI